MNLYIIYAMYKSINFLNETHFPRWWEQEEAWRVESSPLFLKGREQAESGRDLPEVPEWVWRAELLAPCPELFPPPSGYAAPECPCDEGKFLLDAGEL